MPIEPVPHPADSSSHGGSFPIPRFTKPLPAPQPPAEWHDPEELDGQPVDDAAWDVFELNPDEEPEPERSDFPYFDRDELP